MSPGHKVGPGAGAAVYLWDGGPGSLSGPATAPDRLQGGVRQPQAPQLWPLAPGGSGTLLHDRIFKSHILIHTRKKCFLCVCVCVCVCLFRFQVTQKLPS